jgi:hypothetical protein
MKFALLKNFGKKSISSNLISQDELPGDSTPSLFIFGSMHFSYGYFENPHSEVRIFGTIRDIGFSNSWRQPLSGEPTRTHDFSADGFCIDRFLRVERGDRVNSLARIEVKESLVRDEKLRSDIDYTGFEICVVLRDDAFRLFQDHLVSIETDDHWERDYPPLAIRIPVRAFAFPPTRGRADPWETRKNVVGKLRPIKRFNADHIAITMMRRSPLTPVPPHGSLQERYGIWVHSTLSIRYE